MESGEPQVKEEVIELLKEILSRSAQVKFIVTTRESFEFMNLDFQGHKEVRIRPLDEASSQSLVHELLPNANNLVLRRIDKICGHVPLAIKLLCSSISEDDGVELSQFLHDVMEASTESIAEMLDNQDYPTHLRLQFLLNLSFERLSSLEKKALVSFSILPESFGVEVSTAVLGERRFPTKKVLQSLRRKSLLDSSSKHGSFTMHNLVQSFARAKGEQEMKEEVLRSKARFYSLYVSRFETLNEQFLEGNSMSAFLAFCEEKDSFIQSLIESCSDSRTANRTFDVLIKAELLLDSVFWCSNEGANFDKIYDSALKAAVLHGKEMYHRRLLVSRAFGELTWGARGQSMQFLSEVDKILSISSSISSDEKAKHSCYLGLYHFVKGETENGLECLQEALLLMNNSPEQTVLRVIASQILAVYYKFQNNASRCSQFYDEAIQASRKAEDKQLTVIPATVSATMQTDGNTTLSNQPLRLQVMYHVKKASGVLSNIETETSIKNSLLKLLNEVETALPSSDPALFNFYRVVESMLSHFIQGDNMCKFEEEQLRSCQTALEQCKTRFGEQHATTAESYYFLGEIQLQVGDCTSARQSFQSALDIQYVLFGENHQSTANTYHSLGITQHNLGDFISALQSKQHALDIRRTLFGEEHQSTADSYDSLGITQCDLGYLTSALQSEQRALDIRRTLFGEEHQSTADSYHSLSITQHKLGDLTSALQSDHRALDIQRNLFGEKHQSTANSYHSLGISQHNLGNFTSALQSKQRALDIRRTLFGEEHQSTADSYDSLGVTQYDLGYLTSALQSKQRALDIQRTLFGEKNQSTADSYHSLGITQHKLGDFTSARQSFQDSLDIRRTLLREKHQSTADSYHSLGIKQHKLGDFTSAQQSFQRALDIRRTLFGEEHQSTADSYYSLGITQHELRDFTSALQLFQRALDIRRTLFGEKHESTADSYHSLGVAQHKLGDFTSPVQSEQRALDIRRTLFGEEHQSTADSYHSLGITQHKLGDFTSALQSFQRALDIRCTLFGEEHQSTADSYHSLGSTQHKLEDFTSAVQSFQRALDIRCTLFGEEHQSTADSYRSLGITQHKLGDFTSALQSKRRALDIRRILLERTTKAEQTAANHLG